MDKVDKILEHLFKKKDQRKAVKDVVCGGISAYESERRHNAPENTVSRLVKKFNGHIEYLKSLGVEVDLEQ